MTHKPNDSGFNLKTADLTANNDSKVPEEPEPEPAPEPEPEPEVFDSDQNIRDHMIAGEDRAKRRQLLTAIHNYYTSPRFGPYLKKNGFVEDLNKCTLAEMTGLLEDIRFAIQNRGGNGVIQTLVPQAIIASEPIVSTVYDIRGLAHYLVGSETFKDLLEEMALENQIFSNTKASTRLAFEIAKGAMVVHGINANRPAEKPVSLSSQHADLVSQ